MHNQQLTPQRRLRAFNPVLDPSSHLLGKLLRVFCSLILVFASGATFAQSADTAQKLGDPIAYCLSTLAECKPDKQKVFEGKVPGDLRALNGGTQDPVTLVYQLPERDSNTDYAVMVSSRYTNYCMQFDVIAPTVCTERQLTQILLPADAKQILSQTVQIPHVSIWPPNLLWGIPSALRAKSTSERDTIKLLTGWYAFICLAALFQLMTQRNRTLSICLALVMLAMILRINTTASGGFSGIVFTNPDVDRVVEYLTLPMLTAFLLHYYAQLVGNYLLRIRQIFYILCSLSAVIIVLATQPAHILLSLQVAQVVILFGIIVGLLCLFKALWTLELKQSITLTFGVGAVILGFIVDLYFASQSKPQLGGIGLGPFGLAIESMCQYILIALRNDAAHQEAQVLQQELVSTLQRSEEQLTQKVQARTAELQDANQEILHAYNTVEIERYEAVQARQLAEIERNNAQAAQQATALALEKLQSTQAQLIQAEKMASLGLLVSNVAHEINTPIGAIQSSGQTVADSMDATLENMPRLLDALSREHRALFLQLIEHAKSNRELKLSTREERTISKKVTAELEAAGVEGAPRKARLLVRLGAYNNANTYLPLLTSPETDFILSVATGVADVLSGTSNINTAAAKIAGIVASLKQLSGNDRVSAMFDTQVHRTIETSIASLENKLHNVDMVRRYQDMSPLRCDPEALQQVWTHLISNALHASNHQGVIMVGLRASDGQVEVKVTDFGAGMTPEVKDRAFEPFFTTRASGEGGGMGLSIAKNIVDAHKGSIDIQTEVGAGTTVTVTLPYQS